MTPATMMPTYLS